MKPCQKPHLPKPVWTCAMMFDPIQFEDPIAVSHSACARKLLDIDSV